jgi:Zn-dependent protease
MNPIVEIALTVVAAVLAITLHEAAHGYAAMALGDDTAKMAGRLSLNPLRHVDRVGTILLPGGLLLFQLLTLGRVVFMFGWAKPVPVNAGRFRYPRQGMALVAAAGPAMNFCLAFLAALAMHGADALAPAVGDFVAVGLDSFIIINLALGLFNLVPIPPLDGGRIVVGLLPLALARRWARLERAGLFLVLLVVFLLPHVSEALGWRFNPMSGIEWAVLYGHDLLLRLAGYDG